MATARCALLSSLLLTSFHPFRYLYWELGCCSSWMYLFRELVCKVRKSSKSTMMGGFYWKKINGARRSLEEIVTHTKFYLDEGMRIEEGDHEPREVKEKMKWKMTQWSLVIWKFNNHKKSRLIFWLQSNHCACLQSSTEEWIGRGGLRIERQLFVFATGKCAYDDGYERFNSHFSIQLEKCVIYEP